MKKKILAIILAITTVFSGIAWPGEVLAEESKGEVQTETENSGETDVEKLKPSGNLGTFSGIMGKKVNFSVDNGAEEWTYEWRYTEGETIDNNTYSKLYGAETDIEVMITKETEANTYWCHITDANGNEADTIPCRVVCVLDENYVANGICGENITWTLEADGHLTINGTGGFSFNEASWKGYEEQITSASIGEGITEIGIWTFSQIKTLEHVSLPESLKIIDDYAFYKTGLKDITFPVGLEEIGERAFQEAMGSVKDAVYLPDGLKKIGWSAFLNGGMEFIYVPSSVIEIDNYAFSGVASIRCEEGSYAEEYARANNVSYVIVSKTEKDETEENETTENETTFPIENCAVTLESKSLYYDGFAKEPAVTVANGETILKQGVDYVVSYENNVKIGTATVNITGIGTYTGSKRTYFDIAHRFYAKDVVLLTGTPEAEVTTYVEGTEIPNRIVLYVLDEKWSSYLTLPPNFQESFGLNLEGGTIEVISGESVTVDTKGFITPSDTYGESVLRFKKENQVYDIQVKVVDYANYYAQNIMQLYVKENVLTAESDLEKLERICAFVGAYDYSSDYSGYTGMIVAGGGDCVASSSVIIYMCELIGLPAKLRYAVNDSGAGNGHRNVAVQIGEEIYIADAGLDAKAPRTYFIEKTEKGWSYYQTGMNSIKLIQYDGFEEHIAVPSDVNGKTVTTIGEGALYYGVGYSGAKIKSITIPDTITEIGEYAFERSGTLEAIYVDAENEYFASEDGVLFDKEKERLIAYPTSKKGAYTVPSTVKTIGAGSFADVTAMESIQIPGSVKLIETRAFDDCWSLKKIQFLGDAPVIEDYAFQWVKATAFYPADHATWTEEKRANYNGTITWKAWREGDSLEVPKEDETGSSTGGTGSDTGNDKTENNMGEAGTGNYTENIESGNGINLGENENNMGQDETGNGSDNSGVEESMQIGSYLQIGAFEYRITSENEVEVSALISEDKKVVIKKTVSYMGTTYRITGIADKAFKNKKITKLTIGNNIKTIGKSAFEGCKKLTQVTLGNKVTTIGKNAFKNCKTLNKITIKSGKIESVGKNAFKGIKKTAKIKVPKKKKAAYKELLKKAGMGKKVKISG